MDDPRVLRVITVGLILASIVVIYLLFTGGFAVKSKVNQQANNQTLGATPSAALSPTSMPKAVGSLSKPSPTPSSAFNRAAGRTQTAQSGAKTLPNTGFPISLGLAFCTFAMVSGVALRRMAK